jgi:hypothetical protein
MMRKNSGIQTMNRIKHSTLAQTYARYAIALLPALYLSSCGLSLTSPAEHREQMAGVFFLNNDSLGFIRIDYDIESFQNKNMYVRYGTYSFTSAQTEIRHSRYLGEHAIPLVDGGGSLFHRPWVLIDDSIFNTDDNSIMSLASFAGAPNPVLNMCKFSWDGHYLFYNPDGIGNVGDSGICLDLRTRQRMDFSHFDPFNNDTVDGAIWGVLDVDVGPSNIARYSISTGLYDSVMSISNFTQMRLKDYGMVYFQFARSGPGTIVPPFPAVQGKIPGTPLYEPSATYDVENDRLIYIDYSDAKGEGSVYCSKISVNTAHKLF